MQLISLLRFREGNHKARTIIKPLEIKLSGSHFPSLSHKHAETHTHLFNIRFLLQSLSEGACIILLQFQVATEIIIPEHKLLIICFVFFALSFSPAVLSLLLSPFLLSLNANVCNAPYFWQHLQFFCSVFVLCFPQITCQSNSVAGTVTNTPLPMQKMEVAKKNVHGQFLIDSNEMFSFHVSNTGNA